MDLVENSICRTIKKVEDSIVTSIENKVENAVEGTIHNVLPKVVDKVRECLDNDKEFQEGIKKFKDEIAAYVPPKLPLLKLF